MAEERNESCDSRIWCGDCKRNDYITSEDKYLCATCGKILHLDHEVHHEHFPHVSGDKDNLY